MPVKKQAPEAKAPKTIDIELARIKTYVSYKYDLTFNKGKVYTYTEDDARVLLSLKDDFGVPVFRVYKEPEPDPVPDMADNPVNELPKGNDLTGADLKQGGHKVPQALGATKPEDASTVNLDPNGEGEIDTGAGVEV